MGWEWVLLGSGTIAVSVGCLIPARWLPALPNDKLLHFLAFGGLALLAGRLAGTPAEFALWLGGLFLVGFAIEGLQTWVPGRKFCWRDIVANTAGLACAAVAIGLAGGIR